MSYPEIPDSCSEDFTCLLGVWSPVAGELVVDRINKAAGEASLKTGSEVYNYYVASMFTFHDGKEFDATFENSHLHFLHALSNTMTGECRVHLFDKVGNSASRNFGTAPNQEWDQKSFPVGPGTGWSIPGDAFNWAKIKTVRIDCWQKDGEGGGFWTDKLYFTYEVVKPTLWIRSNPIGKHYSLNGVSGYTPGTYSLDRGSDYTVTMAPENFVEWENGSKNPVRTISITENTTIRATYKDANGNGDGGALTMLSQVAAVSTIVATLVTVGAVVYNAIMSP